MSELWRDVVGYEGIYQVSSHGRVRGVARERSKGGILRQGTSSGYPCLGLALNGIRTVKVHWLVAEAFLGPRPERYDVMHLNADRTDNRVENLKYGTRSENMAQRWADERRRRTA